MATSGEIRAALGVTEPLEHLRRGRLPLLVWSIADVTDASTAEIRDLLRELDRRGMALISSWDHAAGPGAPGGVEAGLAVARAQRDLGIEVCVNANALLHRFCDGSPATAHVDDHGEAFFDTSFDPAVPMGCPFALEGRLPEIRGRVERFADAYAGAAVQPSLVFADWEIDGALEWNGAWDAARRCRRCRDAIPEIGDFRAFQRAVRSVRSRLQRRAFAEPLVSRFPGVLVGNYGVYPHGGLRSWYDYFETLQSGPPTFADRGARHREWVHEFADTGYTAAMPVLYPWSRAWGWYEEMPAEYRWIYATLLEASIAGRHTPRGVPWIPFVHWQPVFEDGRRRPEVLPLPVEAYREMLWHILLRGAATFFLWCPAEDTLAELPPVHAVYRESLRYADLLDRGAPIAFDVPREPGTVVSAVLTGPTLLSLRTDFSDASRGLRREVAAAITTEWIA